MEEQDLLLIPTYKLNKEWPIFLATFLAGPLPGAFLIAENFRNLGQPGKAKWTWAIAVMVLVFLFLTNVIPGLKKVPPVAFNFLCILLAQVLVRKYQAEAIRLHILDGGLVYPAGRALVVALIGLVLTVGVIVGLYYWVSVTA